jgi:hypothetical protein
VLSTPQRFSLPELTADLFFWRPFRGLVTAILKEPVYDCGHVGRLTSKAFKSLVASAGLTIEESCFFGAFLPVVTQPWGRNWIGVLRRLDRYWQRWPWRSLLWTQLYVVR